MGSLRGSTCSTVCFQPGSRATDRSSLLKDASTYCIAVIASRSFQSTPIAIVKRASSSIAPICTISSERGRFWGFGSHRSTICAFSFGRWNPCAWRLPPVTSPRLAAISRSVSRRRTTGWECRMIYIPEFDPDKSGAISVGIDIIEIARIQHVLDDFGERFLNRCFTEFERTDSGTAPRSLLDDLPSRKPRRKRSALAFAASNGARWKPRSTAAASPCLCSTATPRRVPSYLGSRISACRSRIHVRTRWPSSSR